MLFRSSGDESVENEYSRLWADIKQQIKDIEEKGIDLDTVREFGGTAAGLESGAFFKSRETHRYFDKNVDDDDLQRYSRSGLLHEMDFGDYTNFFFVTDRGEYAMDMMPALGEQIDIFQWLDGEEGSRFWELGETEKVVQTTEHGEVLGGVRGDLKDDYVVKVETGNLLRGGWDKKLTGRGRETKEMAGKYRPEVITGLIRANPYPDPDSIDPVEIILLKGSSSIGERLTRIEKMMSEKRKAYQKGVEAGDNRGYADVLEEMIGEWHDVIDVLKRRQEERLKAGDAELSDAGTTYISKIESHLSGLEDTINYLNFDNPHPSDLERVRQGMRRMENLYQEEIAY